METREFGFYEQQFIDKLFSFCNQLILKDEKEADKHDTTDMKRSSKEYCIAVAQQDSFTTYPSYSKIEFVAAGMTGEELIDKCLENPLNTPDSFRETLLQNRRQSIIDNYVEKNLYYRTLNGLPPFGEEPLLCTTKEGVTKYVTELTNIEYIAIESTEIASLKERFPTKKYLNHLAVNKIDVYLSRSSRNFYILKYNETTFEEEQVKVFLEIYYECLNYNLTVTYSEAFKHNDLYDNFMALFNIFMVQQRFINEQINFQIKKDLYDMESIRNTFLSYGLPFFEDVPLQYQRRIVKNLNQLIKIKGTNKVIVDIVNLFGFDNIELFKYYLIKDFKRDKENIPIIDKKDPVNSFELKFAQVPIDTNNITSYLREDSLYQDYDLVTQDDPYWGPNASDRESRESFKRDILQKDFNYLNTKYLSMNTMFNVSKANIEISYFFNMLSKFQKNNLLDELIFINSNIKSNGAEIKLFDLFVALIILIYNIHGYKDNILYTPTSIASIYGFNFDGDLEELGNLEISYLGKKRKISDIITNTDYLKVLNIDPEDGKDGLLNSFFNNLDYNELLQKAMNETTSLKEYKALSKIYDYNLYSRSITDLFGEDDLHTYSTYTEYLKNNDAELLSFVESNIDSKDKTIIALNTILNSLDLFLNNGNFDYLFLNAVGVSGDSVKQYLENFINLFKSYDVELKKFNIYYVFDNRYFNKIHTFTEKDDSVEMIRTDLVNRIMSHELNSIGTFESKDNVSFIDSIEISRTNI